MKKYLFSGLLLPFAFLGGCAMPAAHPGATASPINSSANQSSASGPTASYRTVWVPPPVGSLLGGGYVRIAQDVQGNDEAALLGTINQLNAAGGTRNERPFVIAAVSRSTGVSERELQSQQDRLQLQFGQLCAINAIARGDSNKVQEIATLKSKGRTWTELATANRVSIAAVVQTARNANQITVNSYSNSADRAKGGQDKMKSLGVRPQVPPGS
jgi:hypothetical protein